MAQQTCYCGVKSVEAEHASYQVNGAACCTRQCYNQAMKASRPLDQDGFMWGGPHEPAPFAAQAPAAPG